ncbi:MAG TPA: ATP-binding protein, partial [Microcoleaceae cyanobacterium]
IRAYLPTTSQEPDGEDNAESPEDNISKPRQVRVEVVDTGIGIAPEDQEAIFDRFFRVENRVHTLEGTGLGLSIVRNIIEKHRSKVNLQSEVGTGTTFWFDLSVFQEAALHRDGPVGAPTMEVVLPEISSVPS